MTLNVLLVVTFSLLPNPWNNLDDLWTKSVESLGWYNPVWDKVPLFRPRLETSCHLSRCDLEFHWTRLPSDEAVRAGWVLHDGEVGWLGRHTGQWLLTLRLTPRCSCGRKGLWVYIYIYFFFFFFLLAVMGLRSCMGLSLVLESTGYSPVAGHRFLIAGASHCGAQAPEYSLTVVSQGLSCSHTWDLLKPGSSATLTSYNRT